MPRTLEQFGQQIKAKYPDYADMPDEDVASRVLQKYPQYQDLVQSATPNSPQGTGPHNATISASSPDFWDRARDTVFNSAIGHSIQTLFPSAPNWMKPSTRQGTEEYQREQGQLLTPEHLVEGLTQHQAEKPVAWIPGAKHLVPNWFRGNETESDTTSGLTPEQKLTAEAAAAPTKAENRISGAAETVGGFTTPGSLLLIAGGFASGGSSALASQPARLAAKAAFSRLVAAGFAPQMIYGAAKSFYQHHQLSQQQDTLNQQAQQAQAEGRTEDASELQRQVQSLQTSKERLEGSGALASAMALLTTKHAAGLEGWMPGKMSFSGWGKDLDALRNAPPLPQTGTGTLTTPNPLFSIGRIAGQGNFNFPEVRPEGTPELAGKPISVPWTASEKMKYTSVLLQAQSSFDFGEPQKSEVERQPSTPVPPVRLAEPVAPKAKPQAETAQTNPPLPPGESLVTLPLSALNESVPSDQANTVAEYAHRTTKAPPPIVWLSKEGLFIADGNKRVAAAKLRGDSSIEVRMPTAEYERYQATNPSPEAEPTVKPVPRKRGNVKQAGLLESSVLRPIVQAIQKLVALHQAGEDRMHVDRAVRASTQNLFTQADLDEFRKVDPNFTIPRAADRPFLDTTTSFDNLDASEQQTVRTVAKHLGVEPEDLQQENGEWRISDEQLHKLDSMLEEGKKPGAGGTIAPLARIDAGNAAAAGLKNSRSLRELMTPEAKAALEAEEAATPTRATPEDSMASVVAGNLDPQTRDAIKVSQAQTYGLSDANLLGLTEDNPALAEARLSGLQGILQAAIDRGAQALRDRIPEWEQKRSGTSKPSPLAQEVDALPDAVKAQLPKELYDPKHTGASTGDTAETSHVQEPVQGAKATETAPAAQTTNVPANPKGQSPDLVTKIQALVQSLRAEHGDQVAGALSQIWGAVKEKYSDPDSIAKIVHRALLHYQKNLKAGIENPLDPTLTAIGRMPGESGAQTTLHSNPLGEIWNRATKLEAPIGAEMPAGLEPHPLEHPIDSLMDSLGDKKSQTVFQRIGNWVSNEALKTARIARDLTPDLEGQWAAAKVGFDKIRSALKNPFETWKDLRYCLAPGPSAFQALKFQRQVDLLEASLHLGSFGQKLREAIPDKRERSGFAVWAEAHRGPEGPLQEGQESLRLSDAEAEDTIRKQLAQLETRPNGKNSYEAKVWQAALNLSKESKDFLQSYRNYDKLLGQQEAEAGVPHEMLEDYWQHVWKQPGVINSIVGAFKSSVGWQTKASFQKMRTHMSYFDGIQAGLKPVDLDADFLIQNRATASAKVIANRHFLEGLRNVKWEDGLPIAQLRGVGISSDSGTLIKPDISTGKTADGTPYVVSPHPSLRGWKWLANAPEGTPAFGLTDLEIHPDAWKQMKADFESSWWKSNPTGRALMRTNIALKTSKLAYSIFHPVALAQHAAARTALAKLRGVHTEMMLPDGSSIDPSVRMLMAWDDKFKIDPNDAIQRMLLLSGLNISPENLQSMYGGGGPGIQKVPFAGAIASIIHDYTTHSVIPKFAMGSAITNFHTNLARFYEDFQSRALREMGHDSVTSAPQEAVKQANDVAMWKIARMSAKQANYSNGLTPLTDIPGFRGATAADTARFFLLAPQFLFNRGMLMLDAVKPGGAQTLQSMAVQGLATYAFCYSVNKQTQGDDWEPDIHTWNKIVVGKEGEARHEFTMRSELSDAVDLYDDPRRFMQYRLAPTERPVADAITGKDVYGNQITKTQMFLDAITAGSPIPIEGFADLLAPHYDATLRATKGSDAVFNGLAASLGFRRGQYRTTTERMINQNFNAIQAPQTTDELALEQKATFRQLRDKYRQGQLQPDDIEKAVNNPDGNLKVSEIPYLFRTATQPRFVTQAEHLEYGQVLSAWQKGTTLEKYALLPVLEKKVATLAPSIQTEALDRLENFRNSLPEEKQAELQTLLQKKLEVENPK